MAAPSPSLDMTAEPDRFDEAIAEFSKRRVITKAEADAMVAYSRRRAWWIAGVAQMDVANDVHSSIKDAMDRGIPFEEWKKAVEPKLTDAWGRENSPRVQLIFRNATMQAANSGRWDQMHDPAVLQVRPYLQYDAVRDSRECERCEACNGVTLPADDPWWLTHSPILHHACRCGVRNKRVEFGKKHLTKTPPTVKADEGFGVPPTQSVPPVPTERKVKPAPAIHAEFTQKTFKDARERKPKLPKINPMHTPEFWESKYAHYGEARKQVAYGRALLERAKALSAQEAYDILLPFRRQMVRGIDSWDLDELRRAIEFPKKANQQRLEAAKLLAEHLRTSGGATPPPPLNVIGNQVINNQIGIATEFYSRWASPKLNAEFPTQLAWFSEPEKTRSWFAGFVHLAEDADYSVAVHEWAHAIEFNSERIANLIKDFRAPREAGQAVQLMRDVTGNPGYELDETTIPDKYVEPYMGRQYGASRHSEVMSVIFGMLAKGAISQMYLVDPDSLFFGLGLLAGI